MTARSWSIEGYITTIIFFKFEKVLNCIFLMFDQFTKLKKICESNAFYKSKFNFPKETV